LIINDASAAPPSHITCVIPISPSLRKLCTIGVSPVVERKFVIIIVLFSFPSVNIFASDGIFLLPSNTTLKPVPSGRSKDGLSAITVPLPTITASHLFLNTSFTYFLDSSQVIHFDTPQWSAIPPSNDCAIFKVKYGKPVLTCLKNGANISRASVSQTPHTTSIPASRKILTPAPRCFGFSSSHAITTRPIPAAIIASVHGGVLPCVEQGSRVT